MKVIKAILKILGLLILLIVGAVVTIWLKPDLILTQSRISKLFDQYAAPYFSKKPDHIEFKLNYFGFNGKRVVIDTSDFCMKEPDACFSKVHLEVAFKIVGIVEVRIDEVGPIQILNDHFTLAQSKKGKEEEDKPKSQTKLSDYIAIPDRLLIRSIEILFPKVRIEGKDGPTLASFEAHAKEGGDLNILADAKAKALKANLGLRTGVKLNQENPVHLNLGADLGKGKIEGALAGIINWNGLHGDIQGNIGIGKMIPWVDKLSFDPIRIKRDKLLRITSDIHARIEPRIDMQNRDSVLPKARFNPDIRGKFDIEQKDSQFPYRLGLQMADKGLDFVLNANGVYPFPKGQEYRYGLKQFYTNFSIPKFQVLVQNLRMTNSAIPAPFASMAGPLKFELGQKDGDIDQNTLPVSFITELDSPEQTIRTNSSGKITFDPDTQRIKVAGESQIKSIRFTMPDLNLLQKAPAIKNDPRITSTRVLKENPPKKEKPAQQQAQQQSMLDLSWKVRSDPQAIKIYYPILVPYAPIEVTWDIGGNSKSGEIKMLPFHVNFMNRKAKIQKLRYYLSPDDEAFHYEGRVVVPRTEYTIFIDIIDEGDKPKVQLTSSPPLPESDIVSVLLFNQTASELDTDQSSSVASTRSAVANRALGLFSIWALSSTPVEAVNFNPSTGVYSARIKLAKGLTATVGTDWDNSQQVALRKRLGRNFVLSTVLQSGNENGGDTTTTLIEWFKRFQ